MFLMIFNVIFQQLQNENRRLAQNNLKLEQRIKELKMNESQIKELKNVEMDLKQKVSDLITLQQKMSLTLQP